MSQAAKRRHVMQGEPVRVLGRGLRAQRGVHLTLRAIREAVGRTQAEIARTSQIDQGDVSRLEGRGDFSESQVSTLERYIAALGGRLELVATFGEKRITLAGAKNGSELQRGVPANRALQRTNAPKPARSRKP